MKLFWIAVLALAACTTDNMHDQVKNWDQAVRKVVFEDVFKCVTGEDPGMISWDFSPMVYLAKDIKPYWIQAFGSNMAIPHNLAGFFSVKLDMIVVQESGNYTTWKLFRHELIHYIEWHQYGEIDNSHSGDVWIRCSWYDPNYSTQSINHV